MWAVDPFPPLWALLPYAEPTSRSLGVLRLARVQSPERPEAKAWFQHSGVVSGSLSLATVVFLLWDHMNVGCQKGAHV